MYLTEFKMATPEMGRWQLLLETTRESLHSHRDAHDVMNSTSHMSYAQFSLMRRKVFALVREAVCNTETSWPVEAITYSIMLDWHDYH